MTTTQPSQDQTPTGSQRLAAAEAAISMYRLLAVAALALSLVAFALVAWQMTKTRAVAESFLLTNSNGAVMAEMGISAQGLPGLFLYDNDNNTRVWFGIDKTGSPRIDLGDDNGQVRASLFLAREQEQQARVVFRDKDGVPRATYGLAPNGAPAIEFADPQGQLAYRVPPTAGNTPEERWVNFNTAATRAFVQGKLAEAEKLYAAALQQTQSFDPKDLRRAATLNNLGVLYLKAEQPEQAEKVYAAALQIRKEVLGEEHPQYAQSLANMALLRKAQGKLPEADALFKQSIAILEKAYGDDDTRLKSTLVNYAEVLRALNQHKAAAALDDRIAVMRKQVEAAQKAAQEEAAKAKQTAPAE